MSMRKVPLFVVERRRRNPSRRAPRYRISLVRETGGVYISSRRLVTARITYEVARPLFEDADREMFYVLCLDAQLSTIGVNLVGIGTMSGALINPAEVFKPAILLNSVTIICIHNHPSGNPQPSQSDRNLEQRLSHAGEILGIRVKDFMVFGENSYFSFLDSGWLGV